METNCSNKPSNSQDQRNFGFAEITFTQLHFILFSPPNDVNWTQFMVPARRLSCAACL